MNLYHCIYNLCGSQKCPHCDKSPWSYEYKCNCYYLFHDDKFLAWKDDVPVYDMQAKFSNGYCKYCGSPMIKALNK